MTEITGRITGEPTPGPAKVAIVGGGGFRVPMVVEALDAVAPAIALDEIVLFDVDRERAERMELVIRGMRRALGAPEATPALRRTTELTDAVEGALAVLVAIRVGGSQARIIDERVPLELHVLGQETVGPAGIAFAIRTIPEMRRIASVVASHAPTAWFLNFTNPAGMVSEAVRPLVGDRVIGICDSPRALHGHLADALDGRDVDVDYAGLNHLGWAVGVRADGRDALPELLADDDRLALIEEVRLVGLDEVRRLRAIPNEYLVYFRRTDEIVASFREHGPRGAVVHRQAEAFFADHAADPDAAFVAWRRALAQRHASYLAEARSIESGTPVHDGTAAADAPNAAAVDANPIGYGRVAAAFLVAASRSGESTHILNVANAGRLPFLDDDVVVETTCDVSARGIAPRPGAPLPDEVTPLVSRVKEVERLTIRAAVEGRVDVARDAIAAHPVVPSRAVADRILARYMADHASLREILR